MVPSPKSLAAPAPPKPTDPAVDHFQCYKVKRAKGFPKFTKILDVNIEDQFGTGVIDLLKPSDLCAPVNKRGEEPGADQHPFHLMCYKAKGNAPFGTKQVWLGDQFGSLNGVRLSHRPRFCVPSTKNPSATTTTTSTTTTSTSTTSTTQATTTTTTSTTTTTTIAGSPSAAFLEDSRDLLN